MKTKIMLALAIAVTATLVTRPVFAEIITSNTVDLIENSATSLTVLFNGSPLPSAFILNTSADHWTVTFPQAVHPIPFPGASWAEPENPTLNFTALHGWNQVTSLSSTQLSVVSDAALLGEPLANGFQILLSNDVNLATYYRFTDNSDAAVPDTGCTLALLALSLIALLGATRCHWLGLPNET